MNTDVKKMEEKVLNGQAVTKNEALRLFDAPPDELAAAANRIREHFCGDGFDFCCIINGKCGRCPEDCRFCAQSAHYETSCEETYPLLPAGEILEDARKNEAAGVLRYSIVTSGKRLGPEEVDAACEAIRLIRENTSLNVCVSFGLLNEEEFAKIKAAGASRVHCNLETSSRYFPEICTTHTFEEKTDTLKAAKRAGLSICSGGIWGMGETPEDRVDMALTLRELGVRSVPVNLLNPIPGTPLAENRPLSGEEACRSVAVYRFLLPDAAIRLAGGRGLLPDKGKACFESGANAAITGDMLTTSGITVAADMELLKDLGYKVRLSDE